MLRSLVPLAMLAFTPLAAMAEPLPLVTEVEWQPLAAQVRRIVQALELVGEPLDADEQKAIEAALAETDAAKGVKSVQAVLDPLCLVGVSINPESRVKVQAGQAPAKLVQQGHRVFLVKVHNEAGVTAPLRVSSPNAEPLVKRSTGSPDPKLSIKPHEAGDRWMDIHSMDSQPLNKTLSGLPLEYRLIDVYSRDVGRREAKLVFDVGQGTQDLGFRNEVNLLFNCEPAVEVTLEILDDKTLGGGKPTTAHFVIRDEKNRVYPSMSRRLAPDFFFHEQIYRHSGESVMLPPGKYQVTYGRGPEYRVLSRTIDVPDSVSHKETFQLARWIKLADRGWFSGDHHIHAAGCAHYESPSEGVQPVDMMRHILGEDLNIGCVLSWGPCWYFQKQYFEGKVHKLSQPGNLMRYDVEVSGFPSQHCGHLCLLRLTEDDYPGTERIEDWPSWDLPILKWGKEQGGVVGFSHSGWGLEVPATSLPTLDMPKFDGIGANEYIVDVVHDACDFISAVDTPAVWELNVWYHTLNCGYTCRISGETDFPCIYGDKVGLGRAYVKLDTDLNGGQPLDYDRWVTRLRDGASYCCDGLSHLMDFSVGGLGVGEKGEGGRASVLAAKSGQPLEINVNAAALLAEQPDEEIRRRALDEKPYWHVERARVKDTRKVPVELIVNGHSVERQEIAADGSVQSLKFHYTPDRPSWIAVRIFPSSHTNPVFVELDGKPIRASKKSAQWCLDAVDVCWKQKVKGIRAEERPAAAAAFDVARQAYARILAEAADD